MLASLAFCLKILLRKIFDCMFASKGGPTDKNRVYRRKIPAWLVLLAYAIIAQSTPPRFGAQNTRCGGVAKNFSLDNCSSSSENNSSPHTFSPVTQNYESTVRQWKSRFFEGKVASAWEGTRESNCLPPRTKALRAQGRARRPIRTHRGRRYGKEINIIEKQNARFVRILLKNFASQNFGLYAPFERQANG